jgi:AcrR family transcriptional regulator
MTSGEARPAGGSRQRLIESAEELFAARGIDAVSLAELTQAAGLNNTGAVHYYFGGREELLAAVVDKHRARLDARREGLLDELEPGGGSDVELIVRVLVEPMADQLDDPRGRAFLSIQAQRSQRPRRRPPTPRPVTARVRRLLGVPEGAGAVDVLLSDFGRDLAYAALAQRAVVEADGGREAGIGRDEFVQQLTSAIARILTPHPESPVRSEARSEARSDARSDAR